MLLLGGSDNPEQVGIIRDSLGEVRVNIQFAYANPDIYEYLGTVQVNDESIHYFRFRE